MTFITEIDIDKLQKKYDDATRDNIDVFKYEGNEILTSYAKYLLEYLKQKRKGVSWKTT